MPAVGQSTYRIELVPPFRGLLFSVAGFVCGILTGYKLSITPLFFMPFIVLIPVLIWFSTNKKNLSASVLIIAAWFLIGWLRTAVIDNPHLPVGKCWIEGKILAPVSKGVDQSRYRIRICSVRQSSEYRELSTYAVFYTESDIELLPGQKVRLLGELQDLTGPRNPGGFNEESYWNLRGIQSKIRKPQDIIVLDEGNAVAPQRLIHQLREHIANNLREVCHEDVVSVARALLTGDRSGWDKPLREQYRSSGLMHLFAISGLHVGLMVLIISIPLGFIVYDQRKKWLLILLILWLYVPLTGSSPPVIRAVVMATVAAGTLILGRRHYVGYTLCLVFLLLLFWRPSGILDTGFQLSFAGTAGVLLTNHLFQDWRKPLILDGGKFKRVLHRSGLQFAHLFLVSFGAWICTAPILAFSFGQLSFIAWAAAPLALFVVFLALIAGWLVVLFWWIPFVSLIMGEALSQLLLLLESAIGYLVMIDLSLASLSFRSGILLLGCTGIWIWFISRARTRMIPGVLTSVLLVLCLLIFGSLWRPDRALKLAVLDVGQGDGILMKFEKGAVVIDGGNRGSRAVARQIQRSGIQRVELLFLTHGDQDHVGTIAELVRIVDIRHAVVGPGTWRDNAGKEAITALLNAGTKVYTGSSGTVIDTWNFGSFEIIHPTKPVAADDVSDNDLSLVIHWRYDDISAIFPGDLTSTREILLLENRKIPPAKLLIAGHHGSRSSTSSEWLEAIKPDILCISCGRNNPYNHPAPALLERIPAGIELRRTDKEGALLFKVTSSELKPVTAFLW